MDASASVYLLDKKKKDSSLTARSMPAFPSFAFFTLYVLHKPWDPSQLPINSERSHPLYQKKRILLPYRYRLSVRVLVQF